MFSDYLQECIEYYGAYITSFSDVGDFLNWDLSPIGTLFSFCRSMPFFFLCVCLTVVGVLALIKSLFSSKNYI